MVCMSETYRRCRSSWWPDGRSSPRYGCWIAAHRICAQLPDAITGHPTGRSLSRRVSSGGAERGVGAVEILPPRSDLAVAELGDADDRKGSDAGPVGPHQPVDPLRADDVTSRHDIAEVDVDTAEPHGSH